LGFVVLINWLTLYLDICAGGHAPFKLGFAV
jgi:hypothetical protein